MLRITRWCTQLSQSPASGFPGLNSTNSQATTHVGNHYFTLYSHAGMSGS